MMNKLKEIAEILEKIDSKLGFNKFVKYVTFLLIVIAVINYKTVVRSTVGLFNEVSEQIHSEKMQLRDQLLSELYPMLISFRASAGADRILYFEYHNSKENLVGIPFKYFELTLQDSKYGTPRISDNEFKDINTGVITTLYDRVKYGEVAYCTGPEDDYFNNRFPGVYEFFNGKDNSKMMVFISIPGISQPVGLIALEWMEVDSLRIDKITEDARKNYIPRINGSILSKTTKWQ